MGYNFLVVASGPWEKSSNPYRPELAVLGDTVQAVFLLEGLDRREL